MSSILQQESWRQFGAAENLYFKPLKGNKAFCTSRSSNDKAIAVDMNKQGSGDFLDSICGRHGTENGYITVPSLEINFNRCALDLDS